MYKSKSFEFLSYGFDNNTKQINLNYRINDFYGKSFDFTEKFILENKLIDINDPLIDRILFNLHLVCGISYYKLTVPEKIIISSGKLTKQQSNFWNKLYLKGLGQYYFENKLDYNIFPEFPYQKDLSVKPILGRFKDRVLLGFGGGKDSFVSLEILKQAGINFNLIYNILPVKEIAKNYSYKQIYFQRIIDPKLYDKNFIKKFLNGHIPITAIWAFSSLLICKIYDFKYFVFSNEKSSSYGNIKYQGNDINHQWSKSQEFESMFKDYVNKYICPSLKVFSLLRPFYEINVIKMLSLYPQYFEIFTSCNRNFSTINKSNSKWCGRCPKCAFIFLCFACFIDKDKLVKIFGRNLFEDKTLLGLYQQLAGIKDFKPFECVGTIEESQIAIKFLSFKPQWKNDFIIKTIIHINDSQYKYLYKQVFSYHNDKNIPKKFVNILKKFYHENN